MAKFTQSRRRNALASGSLALSFDHTDKSLSLSLRADEETPSGKATYFGLDISADEFSRISAFIRDRDLAKPDIEFTAEALDLANYERRKDADNKLDGFEQTAKALEMAYTMLKAWMPVEERNGNGTLAYIASVARY